MSRALGYDHKTDSSHKVACVFSNQHLALVVLVFLTMTGCGDQTADEGVRGPVGEQALDFQANDAHENDALVNDPGGTEGSEGGPTGTDNAAPDAEVSLLDIELSAHDLANVRAFGRASTECPYDFFVTDPSEDEPFLPMRVTGDRPGDSCTYQSGLDRSTTEEPRQRMVAGFYVVDPLLDGLTFEQAATAFELEQQPVERFDYGDLVVFSIDGAADSGQESNYFTDLDPNEIGAVAFIRQDDDGATMFGLGWQDPLDGYTERDMVGLMFEGLASLTR